MRVLKELERASSRSILDEVKAKIGSSGQDTEAGLGSLPERKIGAGRGIVPNGRLGFWIGSIVPSESVPMITAIID
jgi:hypothetical protein